VPNQLIGFPVSCRPSHYARLERERDQLHMVSTVVFNLAFYRSLKIPPSLFSPRQI